MSRPMDLNREAVRGLTAAAFFAAAFLAGAFARCRVAAAAGSTSATSPSRVGAPRLGVELGDVGAEAAVFRHDLLAVLGVDAEDAVGRRRARR